MDNDMAMERIIIDIRGSSPSASLICVAPGRDGARAPDLYSSSTMVGTPSWAVLNHAMRAAVVCPAIVRAACVGSNQHGIDTAVGMGDLDSNGALVTGDGTRRMVRAPRCGSISVMNVASVPA